MKNKTNVVALSIILAIFVFIMIFVVSSQENLVKSQELITQAEQNLETALNSGDEEQIAVAESALNDAPRHANVKIYGWLVLLPPLIAILLAFITKNVVVSLFLGIALGAFMLQMANPGINIFVAFFEGFIDVVNRMIESMADGWNAGVLLQVLVIGGVIALVTRMGGAHALAEAIGKRAKSARGSQLATWFMGILIFFDDYANSLIAGSVMRPITDNTRVSREKLSFIVDATAAPIAGIALVSTWISTEMSAIATGFADIAGATAAYGITSPYEWFVSSIPYRFYNIFMLAFVLFTIIMLKDMGSMQKAQMRAFKYNQPLRPDSVPMVSVDTEQGVAPPSESKKSIWDAIIPIGILIIGSFVMFWYNGYATLLSSGVPSAEISFADAFSQADASVVLLQVALIASIVALLMGVIKKRFSVDEGIKTWVSGWKGLIITVIILLFAWSLNSTIKSLGTNIFLVNALSSYVPYWFLPAGVFIIGSLVSFATGTAYGTMLILSPLTIPLANSIILANQSAIADPTIYMTACIGGVLTGAIFGDHCSPISDTTILSSMGASVDHMDHVRTQMPYALLIAGLSILFGYLLVGFGLNVWITLTIGIIATATVVFLFGRKPDGTGVFAKKAEAN